MSEDKPTTDEVVEDTLDQQAVNPPQEQEATEPIDSKETKVTEEKEEELVSIPKKRLEELEKAEEAALDEVRLERASAINYRKRLEKERDEFAEIAAVRVLKKLLNVQDDIRRIMENGKESIPAEHLEGMQLLANRVENIFNSEGVTLVKIEERKTSYDPMRHEAILMQPDPELPDRTVITKVAEGFTKGDRVLRAAKVIISKKPPKTEEKKETKEEKPKEEQADLQPAESKE